MATKRQLILYSIVFLVTTATTAFLLEGQLSDISGPTYSGGICNGCNVLVISIEPLQKDHMSLYGYDRETTPFLEQLARNATVFTEAYTVSGHTLPATFSTFTSLYPSQHGVNPATPLSDRATDRFVRLAEVLNQNGYRTVGIDNRQQRRSKAGLQKGFDIYQNRSLYDVPNIISNFVHNSTDTPVFIYLQSFTTHAPYTMTRIHPHTYTSVPWTQGFRDTILERRDRWLRINDESSDTDMRTHITRRYRKQMLSNDTYRAAEIASYDTAIYSADQHIGDMLHALELMGVREDTIIVFTAQHGELLGAHDSIGHQKLYNEVMNIPLIVSVPGMQQQARSDAYVSNLDLSPTLLDLVGVESERFKNQQEGVSIAPLLSGGRSPHPFIFAHHKLGGKTSALIDTRTHLKYLKLPQGTGGEKKYEEYVFNLSNDSEELHPINDSRLLETLRKQAHDLGTRMGFNNTGTGATWPYYG